MIINAIKAIESIGIDPDMAANLFSQGLVLFKGKVPPSANIDIVEGDSLHIGNNIPFGTHIYFVALPIGGNAAKSDLSPKRVTEERNGHIDSLPPDVTIDNFLEKMGYRFRLTKAEKDRGLTREEAFKVRYQS